VRQELETRIRFRGVLSADRSAHLLSVEASIRLAIAFALRWPWARDRIGDEAPAGHSAAPSSSALCRISPAAIIPADAGRLHCSRLRHCRRDGAHGRRVLCRRGSATHCTSSQLSVQFRGLSAASGHAHQDLAFVNHGQLCNLRGWPTVTFLGASGALLSLRAPSRVSEPVRTVTLTDDGHAYFTFKYINEGFCSPRVAVSAIRLTPPGDQDRLVLHRTFSVCTPDPGAAVYPVRSARSFAPTPARTIATVVHGFTPDGRPTFTYSERRGHCFYGSLSTQRRDAWRCEVGNLAGCCCSARRVAPAGCGRSPRSGQPAAPVTPPGSRTPGCELPGRRYGSHRGRLNSGLDAYWSRRAASFTRE
jgi:hypothetical protein